MATPRPPPSRKKGAVNSQAERMFAGAVMSKTYIRGVAVFVNKVRDCALLSPLLFLLLPVIVILDVSNYLLNAGNGNEDEEKEVILKEMGKIRKFFQKQQVKEKKKSAAGKQVKGKVNGLLYPLLSPSFRCFHCSLLPFPHCPPYIISSFSLPSPSSP